ncbi:hypothetical protein BJV82DRAFT_712012 [Fennellomyces sp. T-0311]|nr:hypothetical protein BJV82DRAFT_712012 [Fennellomyces sp. T-0311]
MLTAKRKTTDSEAPPSKRTSPTVMRYNAQHSIRERDLIAECPYEIMCNVLYQLDFDTIYHCLSVSRTWRERISSVAPFWRKIENAPWGFWHDEKALIILPFVSRHVEEIRLVSYATEVGSCVEALRINKFLKMQTLSLAAKDLPYDTTTLTVPIYYALARLQNTLTKLHLETGWHSPLSMRVLLSICPNLTVLKINTVRMTGDNKELRTPHTSLISFEVTLPSAQNLRVQRILRSVPNIRHLMICHRSIVDLLPTILQYCRRLSMITNQSLAFDPIKNAILHPYTNDDTDQKGLQCIALHQLCLPQYVLPLLAQCRSTLKHIYIRGGNYLGAEIGWQHLSLFAMPQLTGLHIVCYTKSLLEQIAALIRGSPNLQVIGLKNNCVYWNQQELEMAEDIFTALLELTYLSSLSLTRFDVRSQVFMQILENRMMSNSLKVLSMINCTSLRPTALHVVARMQSLEVLDLTGSMSSMNQADVNEFASMVEHLLRLQHLGLASWKISNEAAHSIIRSKSLRKLYVDRIQITYDARMILDPITTAATATGSAIDEDFRWMNYF